MGELTPRRRLCLTGISGDALTGAHRLHALEDLRVAFTKLSDLRFVEHLPGLHHLALMRIGTLSELDLHRAVTRARDTQTR